MITIYKIKRGDFITSAFNRIPSNSMIDKGECGIGGTTLEINDNRHSIIVVPNLSAIKSKKERHINLCGVHSGVKEDDIVTYMSQVLNDKGYLKIMTTPESLHKVIKASEIICFDVFNECFLLLDEAHAITTEGNYRHDIIKVYEHFFHFKDKSTISATPYVCTDTRLDALNHVQIIVEGQEAKQVKIIFSVHILHALEDLVKEVRENGGNIHIFYNSVRGIADVIDIIGEAGVSIFCSDNARNEDALGKYYKLVRNTTTDGFSANPINLYTCGHYEGWDLFDSNATIVFLSDVEDDKTCLNVATKAKQAIGRLRGSRPNKVYHITNIKEEKMEKILSESEIGRQVTECAVRAIGAYNFFNSLDVKSLIGNDFFDGLSKTIERASDLNPENGEAVLNPNKIDTEIYIAVTKSKYVDRESLIGEWKGMSYNVETIEDNKRLSIADYRKLKKSRTTKNERNKILIDSLHNYMMLVARAKDNGEHYFGTSIEDDIIEKRPDLYKFYLHLGYERIVGLNYNIPLMREAYTIETNNNVVLTAGIAKLLYADFKSGHFYTRERIKTYLQALYNKFDGLSIKAKATDIYKYFYANTSTKQGVRGFVLGNKKFFI